MISSPRLQLERTLLPTSRFFLILGFKVRAPTPHILSLILFIYVPFHPFPSFFFFSSLSLSLSFLL
jgi:hypothetical protein